MSDETAVAVDSGEPVSDPLIDVIDDAELSQLRARVAVMELQRIHALRAAVSHAVHHGWCDVYMKAIIAQGYTEAEVVAMAKITVEVPEAIPLVGKSATPSQLRSGVAYAIRNEGVRLIVRLGDGSLLMPVSGAVDGRDDDDEDDD